MGSWGEKDDKKYFHVFSAFPFRQYMKWRMLSAWTLGKGEERNSGEQKSLLLLFIPLSL